jgi:outer membrane receptor for ferrienterochelin and colicins
MQSLNFTPDEKNDIDLDYARELQDRNSTPGMSKAAETCRGSVWIVATRLFCNTG